MRLKFDFSDKFDTIPSTPTRYEWGKYRHEENNPRWMYISYENTDVNKWWNEVMLDLRKRLCG